ncbi:hypothetical protein H0248_20570, partial [Pectobacterium brasiliense]|nr:hypothetical protein [Pectobacterium brasiliense]
MSQDKSSALAASGDAAKRNFTTDNKISGGCTTCGCEILVYYHYDSGDPIPNAPFQLTDSNNHEIRGKTDENGLFFIHDMGCRTYELILGEGSDTFDPKETVQNNPVLMSNPAYASFAGEYFSLFVILRAQGLVEYGSVQQSVRMPLSTIPDQYKPALKRFWELERQLYRSDSELQREIRRIQHQQAAEVASKASSIDNAVLLFCEVILGCIPVVGQVIDVYFLGKWCWDSYEDAELLNDTMHQIDGVLCVIGFVPGAGDALKVSGNAITQALRKLKGAKGNKQQHIEEATQIIRSLSNGNIVNWLMGIRSDIRIYADKGKKILETMKAALDLLVKGVSGERSWIVVLMADSFRAMVNVLEKLISMFTVVTGLIEAEFAEFIPQIMTQVIGSARPKGSCELSAMTVQKGGSGDYRTEEEITEFNQRAEKPGGLTMAEAGMMSSIGIFSAMPGKGGKNRVGMASQGGKHSTSAPHASQRPHTPSEQHHSTSSETSPNTKPQPKSESSSDKKPQQKPDEVKSKDKDTPQDKETIALPKGTQPITPGAAHPSKPSDDGAAQK